MIMNKYAEVVLVLLSDHTEKDLRLGRCITNANTYANLAR